MNEAVVWLTIFVLSVFVGIEVISKVSSTLHTPLMSGRQRDPRHHPARRDPGHRHHRQQRRARRRAGRDRARRGEHGRRLRGHRPDAADVRAQEDEAAPRPPSVDGRGRSDPDLGPAGLPGLRGLLHPRAQGALRARRPPAPATSSAPPRPSSRARSRSSTLDLDHVPLILAAIAVGTAGGVVGARARADDPDAADGGAVQRRRRRRGRAGRAARAARARSTPAPTPAGSTLAATAFTILVGSVSFAGSVVTFAKLQELMTSRAGGLPRPADRLRRWRSSPPSALVRAQLVTDPADAGSASCWRCVGLLSACCWCCRSAAPTYRS